jgi:hypothetical protein
MFGIGAPGARKAAECRGQRQTWPGLLLGLVLAGLAYLLSVGPIDYLVEHGVLPMEVLRYQVPLYSIASHLTALGRLLDWYIEKVWRVNQAVLRDAPPARTTSP